MPKIFPFSAFRYSFPAPRYADLICPPYDIISDSLAEKLRKKSLNAIHLELPAGNESKKYLNARECWCKWLKRGVLKKDQNPSFYIYQQSFQIQRRALSRTGFFCEVALEKPGEGSILRHELTLAKPKKDRLELLRKTKVNTSPIFGLFADNRKTISRFLQAIVRGKPDIQFSDSDRVTHRLWLCNESAPIKKIQKVLRQTKIVIADGHHRYETAWEYFQQTKQVSTASVLFYLCPRESPGLVIFPTHRVLRSHWEILENRLHSLKNIFKFQNFRSFHAQSIKNSSFLITDGKKTGAVTIRFFTELKKKFPQYSPASLKLSLFLLHEILLPELKKEDFIYTHDEKEAVKLARTKGGLAFIVPAVRVQELFAVVKEKELMPQKSTYFYPKIPTGILFRSLE